MKKLLFLILILNFESALSQENVIESFSNLEELKIRANQGGLEKYIKFDKANSKVINERLNLDYKYLEQGNNAVSPACTKLIVTKLNKNSSKKHFITWGAINGPSRGFAIFEANEPYKMLGVIYSSKIIVPGNGFIYSIEREDHNFYVKKKYVIYNDSISEVKQPYYGVNIDSYALEPITIYEDESLTKSIAVIPKQGAIKVLLAKESNEYESKYLVQSSFGLVGWTKIKAAQYRSMSVEGIYYYGD